MNLEKLKDQARKFEQKDDWRRAIDAYLKAIDEFESGREPTPDLSLYNRIGDLYMKTGDAAAAVRSYERAVDLYADQGFYNNAIALCSKILRVQPQRVPVHLRLAYLHAHKNVLFEAKRHLLEYLERMNSGGHRDEGFAALAAFADQFAGNPDIRLMLVDLMLAAGRSDEAVAQLSKAVPELEGRGDDAGADRARARLQQLAPDMVPPSGAASPSYDDSASHDEPPPYEHEGRSAAIEGLTLLPDAPAAGAAEAPIAGLELERTAEPVHFDDAAMADVGSVSGFDSAAVEPPGDDEVAPLDGLVIDGASSLSDDTLHASGIEGLELEAAEEADLDISAAPLEGLDREDPSALGMDLELTPPGPEFELSEPGPVLDADEPLHLEAPESLDLDVPESLDLDVPEPLELESAEPLELEAPEPLELEAREPSLDFELVGDAAPDAGADLPGEAPVELPFLEVDDEPSAADQIATLEDRVLDDPASPEPHETLGRALAEAGDVTRAVGELDLATRGYADRGDIAAALSTAEAILAITPDDVQQHQQAVELAFRVGDRARLLAAYVGLGSALARAGETEKAEAVFRRVLEHEPANPAANEALAQLAGPVESPAESPAEAAESAEAAEPEEASQPAEPSQPAAQAPPAELPPAPPARPASGGADFVDLGSLVLEDEGPRDTRMRLEGDEPETSGDEQRDFEEMLDAFKRGIEENLDDDDHQAHYDLGIAFKEMGLLDEAIGEFQKALRGADGRLRTAEALGQAFYEKGQFGIAETVLLRAVTESPAGDDEKIGLIYWLGRSLEAQGKRAQASASYERALAVDIRFMDLSERMQRLTAERGA